MKDQDAMVEGKLMKGVPYSNDVGSTMYAMVSTRPDIAYGVGLISRFMSRPGRIHWQAVKWLLRYLKETTNLRLLFEKDENTDCKTEGYCDSNFAGDLDKRRSLFGYVFTLGGNTVNWKSSLQHVASLSSTEAEYIALTEDVKEAIWLKGFCEGTRNCSKFCGNTL